MSAERIDHATSVWEGEFILFGVPLKCHVLDDGRRIVEADSIAAFFAAVASFEGDPMLSLDELAKFQAWQRGT